MSSRSVLKRSAASGFDSLEVSFVLPCLNEARTLAACLDEIQTTICQYGLRAEIIVADNGSTDGSPDIARRAGATVVPVTQRGYGSALLGGIGAATGRFVVMGDTDLSYNFTEAPALLSALRTGHDLVMGNRFKGGIRPGAMPFLHRYLGNPVLSMLGQVLFGIPVGDFHCGLRAFRRDAFGQWQVRATGMEFASELVIRAARHRARMTEVPVSLRPDGRDRPPHLRTWRDGWRHLTLMLRLWATLPVSVNQPVVAGPDVAQSV